MHRDDVGVGVRHVDAGEGEAHPLDPVQALHVTPELLPQVQDVAGEIGGHVLVIGVMLLRDDEGVARAHRLDVQEGQQALVFVDDVRGDLVPRDAAEQTVVGHACLGENGWLGGMAGAEDPGGRRNTDKIPRVTSHTGIPRRLHVAR
ncbi:hypothetical protein G6F65_021032 [Rhizopus arrhizus]|nr:hypothetical protein G6F65_021032 [Rhizopus arrhizus]